MVIIKEEKEVFQEKLEPATKQQFKILQRQTNTDPELKRMLTSPMKEISQYYWLYEEYGRTSVTKIEDFSLLNILEFFINSNRYPILFSKSGSKFTGFVLYKKEGKSVTAMKTASFYDDKKKSNPVLAFDLINFVEKEISGLDKIEWKANVNNKWAIQQYDASLKKKKFIYTKLPDEKNSDMVVYTVTGKAS